MKREITSIEDIIERVTVDCKDNGSTFTDSTKLYNIKDILDNSRYESTKIGLFELYTHKDIDFSKPIVLISSHVDTVPTIHHAIEYIEVWKGTFDNAITNAIITHSMKHNQFSPNVVIAFTGDEERSSKGADEVANYLLDFHKADISQVLVTDITHEGWTNNKSFTIENVFQIDEKQNDKFIRDLIHTLYQADSNPLIIPVAMVDESYAYARLKLNCLSLCMPTCGPMHTNSGLLVRKLDISTYTKALIILANGL